MNSPPSSPAKEVDRSADDCDDLEACCDVRSIARAAARAELQNERIDRSRMINKLTLEEVAKAFMHFIEKGLPTVGESDGFEVMRARIVLNNMHTECHDGVRDRARFRERLLDARAGIQHNRNRFDSMRRALKKTNSSVAKLRKKVNSYAVRENIAHAALAAQFAAAEGALERVVEETTEELADELLADEHDDGQQTEAEWGVSDMFDDFETPPGSQP